MTLIQAFILGMIQGITEFLPVSSSGHLALAEHIFGFVNLDSLILFDLVCHLGTLCAIFLVYRNVITSLLRGDILKLKQIVLGTLPLFLVLPILKQVENLYDKPHLLGLFFWVTAAILYLGILWGKEKSDSERYARRWKDPIYIGFFQTLALIPGISRSGATISAARLRGWKREESVTFSFLLAIPAILGGTFLKSAQFFYDNASWVELSPGAYLIGFISSLFFGYFALMLLIRLALKDRFLYFVWYCLLLGIAVNSYFFIYL